MKQSALRHHEFGKPAEVLRLEEIDVPEPGPGEVRIRLLAAAINPSDFGMIGGSYGRLRELPAVAGREGVGEIDALGAGVEDWQPGDRVRFPGDDGAWREFVCAPAGSLLAVPAEVPVEQAALSFVNPPTAWCLLKRVAELQPGDWVVQNAGNSAVGLSVIQLARDLGLHTLSTVRRPELCEPLAAAGADAVCLEGDGWPKRLDELTGGARPRLALNSVGGESAIDQVKALADGGSQFTFGGMVGDPVRFPTRFLIFNDVRLRGFWWDRWSRDKGPAETAAVLAEVHSRMADGRLRLPVEAVYSFADYEDALAHAGRPRLGKVLLAPRGGATD